ncbi:MAG: hypothetical protein JWM11_5438, partial [Planctomycetaceae bacterium]|nr:hypothetical protein [Planctomycetaceae bacterium]
MMRPTGSGPLSALLVLAPLVALPILAVVGIPQFAPGNLIDSQNPSTSSGSRKGTGALESRLGEAAHSDADDLFAPLGKSNGGFEDPLRRTKKKARLRTTRNEDGEPNSDRDSTDSDDSPDSETGTRSRSRPRGKSPSFADAADDEAVDADAELNNAGTSGRGSRTRPRSPARASDFGDENSDDNDVTLQNREATAEGEQFADASEDFSNTSKSTKSRGSQIKRQPPASDDADAVQFEAPPAAKSPRTAPKGLSGNRPPVGRPKPVDPNDAPPF